MFVSRFGSNGSNGSNRRVSGYKYGNATFCYLLQPLQPFDFGVGCKRNAIGINKLSAICNFATNATFYMVSSGIRCMTRVRWELVRVNFSEFLGVT